MERRIKPAKASTGESSVGKAAAWAWYQHGAGSEGKLVREFDLIRAWRAPGPSRYKLEATRIADDNTTEGSSPPHTDSSSLIDAYEVGRIFKHLEYLIESSSGNYYRNRDHGKDGSASPENWKKKKKSSKRLNGFLVRHAGTRCGSRGDVVEGRMLIGTKNGSVVGLAKCRPRVKDAE